MPINSLLLKPAGPDCNIRCAYCFYAEKEALFDKRAHRMSMETVRAALSQYILPGPSQLSLGFQGGEPTLMGLKFFKETHTIMEELRRPDQQIAFSLQTNGILLDENWAAWLKEKDVLVGLSMDGPADLHDTYRRGFDGTDTHARVSAAMALLKQEGVAFNNLCVINAANYDKPDTLVDFFLEEGSGYMQFIPCVEADGGILPFSAPPEGYGEFLCAVFDRWMGDGMPSFYVRMFDELLITFMEYMPASCYFSHHCVQNLVIEHDGSVYPCDFFVTPALCLGNVHASTLEEMAASAKMEEFLSRKPLVDDACQACDYLPLCGGDCLKYRLDADGRPAQKSYFCRAYQMFFAHALPKLRALKRRLLSDPSFDRAAFWARLNATGRNEACPCASGKKHKQCCLPLKGV